MKNKKKKIPESLRRQLSRAGKKGWENKVKKAEEKAKVEQAEPIGK